MNGFYSRSYRFGIRLRPAKVSRQALKKLFDLFALYKFFLFRLGLTVGR